VGTADRRGDRGCHVAVLDQLDARACGSDLLDQVVVTRSVEHDRRHVVDAPAECLRDAADVVGNRSPQVDGLPGEWPDRHLPHVHVRQGLQRSGLADRDHRHRPARAARDHAAPLERVEREIDLLAARAEALAEAESLVVAARADDDVTVDRQHLERVPHRVDSVLLSTALVGAPEPASPGERRAFGHARVALAQAVAADAGAVALNPNGHRFRHPTLSNRSADSSTSSIAWPMASSMFEFSITGTEALSARATM